MSEPLTREDIKIALQEALHEIGPMLEPIMRPIAASEACKVSQDKIERVLGIDCTNPDARKRGRRAMEAASELRDWKDSPAFEEARKNNAFAGKARAYFEDSDEGKQRLADAKRFAKIFDSASMNLGKNLFYVLIGLGAFLGGSGIINTDWVASGIRKLLYGH